MMEHRRVLWQFAAVVGIGIAFPGCTTLRSSSKPVYYVLDGPEVSEIGRRHGFHIEALGMFNYRLRQGTLEIDSWFPVEIRPHGSARYGGPIRLCYRRKKPLTLESANDWNLSHLHSNSKALGGDPRLHEIWAILDLHGGVTMESVDRFIRSFVHDANEFENESW